MNKVLKRTLAKNLTAFRLRAGMSQSDLARKAGTSQPRVAIMESGEDPTLPRVEWLAKVANALGVTLSDLFSDKGQAETRAFPALPEREETLGAHLKRLGAPLTGPSKPGRPFSPESVVLGVLRAVPSARMVEFLPALLAKKKVDYRKLVQLAQHRGLVNRLGFVVDTAALLAEEKKDSKTLSSLRALSARLWRKRNKNNEEFLTSDHPRSPEFRDWLKKTSLPDGKKWGVYGAYSLERFREAFRRAA